MRIAFRRLSLVNSLALAIGFLLSTSGCTYQAPQRPDRAILTGVVTYQGKALPGGAVSAVSTQDTLQGCTGAINEVGVYTMKNAPLGLVKIAVATESMQLGAPGRYVPIPAKYADPETSGITVEIKASETNKLDINLD